MLFLNVLAVGLSAIVVIHAFLPHRIDKTVSRASLPALPIIIWLASLLFFMFSSTKNDGYASMNDLETTPILDWFIVTALSTVECVFIGLINRLLRCRLLLKNLVLLIAFIPWAAFWVMSSMHAAPVFATHALWQALIVIGIATSLTVSLIRKSGNES